MLLFILDSILGMGFWWGIESRFPLLGVVRMVGLEHIILLFIIDLILVSGLDIVLLFILDLVLGMGFDEEYNHGFLSLV